MAPLDDAKPVAPPDEEGTAAPAAGRFLKAIYVYEVPVRFPCRHPTSCPRGVPALPGSA